MLDDYDMDAVFQALGNASRRRMLDTVKSKPGIRVGTLASEFDVSRIAVMKHLAVWEVATAEMHRMASCHQQRPYAALCDRWYQAEATPTFHPQRSCVLPHAPSR